VSNWNGAAATKRITLVGPDGMGSSFGFDGSGPGDVNGDSLLDIVVGAPTANGAAGVVHLYLGVKAPTGKEWNGANASQRIDINGPDGSNALFGVVWHG
jgi:hypothetical protein